MSFHSIVKIKFQCLLPKDMSKAMEQERKTMLNAFEEKMNDLVEKRDRFLTQQLSRSIEEKQLEIAAALEKRENKNWWSRLFSK